MMEHGVVELGKVVVLLGRHERGTCQGLASVGDQESGIGFALKHVQIGGLVLDNMRCCLVIHLRLEARVCKIVDQSVETAA